jgi:hypothetical protein
MTDAGYVMLLAIFLALMAVRSCDFVAPRPDSTWESTD